MKLRPIFVEALPDFGEIREGDLWISHKHRAVNLRCPCGCGRLTVLSIQPSKWHICFDGESVSLVDGKSASMDDPAGGSVWTTSGCGSHYLIRKNTVIWAEWIDPRCEPEYADDERSRMLALTSSRRNPLWALFMRVWRFLSRRVR